jgi:hypothetical protein
MIFSIYIKEIKNIQKIFHFLKIIKILKKNYTYLLTNNLKNIQQKKLIQNNYIIYQKVTKNNIQQGIKGLKIFLFPHNNYFTLPILLNDKSDIINYYSHCNLNVYNDNEKIIYKIFLRKFCLDFERNNIHCMVFDNIINLRSLCESIRTAFSFNIKHFIIIGYKNIFSLKSIVYSGDVLLLDINIMFFTTHNDFIKFLEYRKTLNKIIVMSLLEKTSNQLIFNSFTMIKNHELYIIIGNENIGISPQILKYSDLIYSIKISDIADSLSIISCVSIIGYLLQK